MSFETKPESYRDLLLICLLVSLCVVTVDLACVPSILQQWGTLTYREARGTIRYSDIQEQRAQKGSTYVFNVRYAYQVDGRAYTNDEVVHTGLMGTFNLARELKDRFPLNAAVGVYYPAREPARSVLLKGPQGSDLLYLMLLFPPHLALWWAWYALVRVLRRRADGLGAVIIRGRTHVSLDLGLDVWLGVGLGIFFGSATLGLVTSGFPSRILMAVLWAGVLAVCGLAAYQREARVRSGALDLILDERREQLLLPPLFDRTARLVVPLSRIQGLRVEQCVTATAKRGTQISWKPMLTFVDAQGESEEVTLADWDSGERAQRLVDWLQTRLQRSSHGRSPAQRGVG